MAIYTGIAATVDVNYSTSKKLEMRNYKVFQHSSYRFLSVKRLHETHPSCSGATVLALHLPRTKMTCIKRFYYEPLCTPRVYPRLSKFLLHQLPTLEHSTSLDSSAYESKRLQCRRWLSCFSILADIVGFLKLTTSPNVLSTRELPAIAVSFSKVIVSIPAVKRNSRASALMLSVMGSKPV